MVFRNFLKIDSFISIINLFKQLKKNIYLSLIIELFNYKMNL